MPLGPASYGLGFLAGLLSILSPCVLPLVPIVVGTAVAAHPLGALALAFGLAVSFTSVGLFVATAGFAIGLDAEWFRRLASLLLIAFGAVLLSGSLQQRFASATSSLSTFGHDMLSRMKIDGLTGRSSASCSASSGRRASDRRWARPRHLQAKAAALVRSRL